MPEPTDEVKPSWGDMMEDLDGNTPLPPSKEEVQGNTKKVVEYKINDEGKTVKITRTYNLETIKVSKTIARRKMWKKFGLATKDNPNGPDRATTFVGEDVFLTFTTNKDDLEEENKDQPFKVKGSGLVKCRLCKGDHWTKECPYKESVQPLKDLEDKEKTGTADGAAATDLAKTAGAGGPAKYIPPSLRGGADAGRKGETMNSRRQDEYATLRVTNLSEDACEPDIQELFRPFGPIARVYLAKDKITNQSKGFAFVSYIKREDASRAIQALQGFGYDHLILNVEWAKPSTHQ